MKQSVVGPSLFEPVKAITRSGPSLVRQVLAAGIMLSSFAQAAPITYNFTGKVDSVSPALSGTFNTSQTMSGSFTYESTNPGVLCSGCSESNGYSDYYGAVKNFTMTIGGYTAQPPFGTPPSTKSTADLQISNDWFGYDRFGIASVLAGTQFNGFNPLAFLSLEGATTAAFSSTSLLNVGDLSGLSGFFYLAFSSGGGDPRVLGTLTSISKMSSPPVNPPTGVPAPGVLILMVSGLAMMSCIRRSKMGDISALLSRS